MAEFGVQATQLSEAQGRGANVLPVAQPTNPTVFEPLMHAAASIFKKKDTTPVTQYAEDVDRINQGLETGAIKPEQALAEARKLHSRYLGRYPQFTTELSKVHSSFMEGSQLGEAKDEVASERQLRQQELSDASKAGFDVPHGSTEQERTAIVSMYKTKVRNQQASKDFMENKRFEWESTKFNQEQVDRDQKDQSAILLAQTAGTYTDGFNSVGSSLSRQVQSDPQSAPQAQAELARYYTQIRGEIAAVASTNPGLASHYSNLFSELYETNKKLLDPVKKTEEERKRLEDELAITKARIQGIALKSPSMQQAYALNSLGGQTVVSQFLGTQAARDLSILLMQKDDSPNRPPLIGNTEVETDVLKASKAALDGMMKGKFVAGKDRSEQESVQMANNILSEVSKQVNDNNKLNPKVLMPALDWAASPEVGQAAKAGLLTPQARMGAKQVFQMGMQQPIAEKLNNKLESLTVAPGPDGKATPVMNFITDFEFDGANVKVKWDTSKRNMIDIMALGETRSTIPAAEDVLTKLVRAAAHMEGHTDYKKAWEAIRHNVLPSLYKSPEPLPIGYKANAGGATYEYLGGPDGRASSWRKLPSATNQ